MDLVGPSWLLMGQAALDARQSTLACTVQAMLDTYLAELHCTGALPLLSGLLTCSSAVQVQLATLREHRQAQQTTNALNSSGNLGNNWCSGRPTHVCWFITQVSCKLAPWD